MNSLIQSIQKYIILKPELEGAILDVSKARKVKKKFTLLEIGQKCNSLYFIEKGILRGYYYNKRKDITTWFSMENEFATSTYSFISENPSHEGIEALEDCELIEISARDLNQLYMDFPEFNLLGRKIMEIYYVLLEERTIYFQSQPAQERYNHFLRYYSHVFSRIPLTHIASFLGITKETLSRIRA